MARFFNGQEVELLAPAGNFSIFNDIIQLNCDAVYLGGKILNMRLHRKDFNFTDDELRCAVQTAHDAGKKIYITVNNLHSHADLEALPDYLSFLNELQPDALIIQDFSILTQMRKQGIFLPLHASVMAHVHNLATINRLSELGISRVVLSRETPLSYINSIKDKTPMEFEYFVHGDMCVANGGQCLYSAFVFGQSSNRGLCMKPCRWQFDMKKDGKRYATRYPLAVKDMCMISYIPELIESGVTSFKIEGRMREIAYLQVLVDAYGDAIDRYCEEPLFYDRAKDAARLQENRNRDLSTAYAFGKPGLRNINERYEGTGKFYSTGKVFSTATQERSITPAITAKLQAQLNETHANRTAHDSDYRDNKRALTLSVRVNTYEQAQVCINRGVGRVYLSGEPFLPGQPLLPAELRRLAAEKNKTKLFFAMPRMMTELDFSRLASSHAIALADGFLCTNLGVIAAMKQHEGKVLAGDASLNIYNSEAARFYLQEGLQLFTLSAEMPAPDAAALLSQHAEHAEMIVHGAPTMLYLDHDLFENLQPQHVVQEEKNTFEPDDVLVLVDEKGTEHPVYKDTNGRCHILPAMDICLLPLLAPLHNCGLTHIRIEGCHYTADTLDKIISLYQQAITSLTHCGQLYDSLCADHTLYRAGLTYGAFGMYKE